MNLVHNEMQELEKAYRPALGLFPETGSRTAASYIVRIALLLVHCGSLFEGTLRQG